MERKPPTALKLHKVSISAGHSRISKEVNPDNRGELAGGYYYQEFLLRADNQENELRITEREGFYLIYCWEGSICFPHSVKEIGAFQSAIIFNRKGKKLVLNLKTGCEHRFCIVGFWKYDEDENSAQTKLFKRFEDFYSDYFPDSSSFYVGLPYLKLLEKMNELSQISKSGFASELIMQGSILQIFGFKMEHMIESMLHKKRYGSLKRGEIDALNSIVEFIRHHPELDYTIDFLSKKTGLSPLKLQEGFKGIYGRTVIDFIRHVRLEKALELLKTTDMNISEIVYSIGLTSRSYFSKIFKAKYKFCPKDFQELYQRAI